MIHPQQIPIFQDISFNSNAVEEYVFMEPFHPKVFDYFCEDGWCYWSDFLFRKNYMYWRDKPCRIIILRIRLDGFKFSRSQRKSLRQNADLRVERRPLTLRPEHLETFKLHADRFSHNRPGSAYSFFSDSSHVMPSTGMLFDVYDGGQYVASSFFHLGEKSMAGNYCFYHPNWADRSLGTFTMLREIQFAIELGKEYYYPGFVYDRASEFDYKLNFNNLEYFDWWGNWYPLERLAVRDWRALYDPETLLSMDMDDPPF
jgi:arginine-tRNA-protein transferase